MRLIFCAIQHFASSEYSVYKLVSKSTNLNMNPKLFNIFFFSLLKNTLLTKPEFKCWIKYICFVTEQKNNTQS